jgi:hypothetical protein
MNRSTWNNSNWIIAVIVGALLGLVAGNCVRTSTRARARAYETAP